MGKCCSGVELHGLLCNDRVQLGILLFGGLSVEHNVGHGSILESSEVVETIDAALVKVSVFILIIAILLVRVNHEI